jgi:hypothetical protein
MSVWIAEADVNLQSHVNPDPKIVSKGKSVGSDFSVGSGVEEVMRNLNAEVAGRDAHLSSMAPTSVDRAYHKIWRRITARRSLPNDRNN